MDNKHNQLKIKILIQIIKEEIYNGLFLDIREKIEGCQK